MRIVAALVGVGLVTTTAFADPPGATPPSAPVAAPEESYRFQTGALSGIALVSVIGTGGNRDAIGTVALGTYLFGAPIIHLFHHRPGRALGSLAMRAGIPLAAGFFLESLHTNSCPPESTQCDDYTGLGLALV